VPAPTQAILPISADDVCLSFPAPTRAEDFDKLIAVRDLTPECPGSVKTRSRLADVVFQQFVAIARCCPVTTETVPSDAAEYSVSNDCDGKVKTFVVR
jgi:hypothetical protein